MGGIVGCVSSKECQSVLVQALQDLSYRQYDSVGCAVLQASSHRILYHKGAQTVHELEQQLALSPLKGCVGIGHLRLAARGAFEDESVQPHCDSEVRLALVHNGVIDQCDIVLNQLHDAGYDVSLTSDTHILVHYLEMMLKKHETVAAALTMCMQKLRGAFSCAIVMHEQPDQLIVMSKGSPVWLCFSKNQTVVVSDLAACPEGVSEAVLLPYNSWAYVRQESIELFDDQGQPLSLNKQRFDPQALSRGKDGFEHVILKEIHEQKDMVQKTVLFYHTMSSRMWDHCGITLEDVARLDTINLVGCGTSLHAARIAQFFFESICLLPTQVHMPSEFRYLAPADPARACYIAISQSGETPDTIDVVHQVQRHNIPTIALTNVTSSTLVRECDGFLLTQAGRDNLTRSLKAFSAQLAVLFWLAHRVALARKIITPYQMRYAEEQLLQAAYVLEDAMEHHKLVLSHSYAQTYAEHKKMVFVGRHVSYPFALEAALKFKELTGDVALAYPAGELKHGPIMLINEQTPVVMCSALDADVYATIVANAQEIKKRGAQLIVLAFEGQHELIDCADSVMVIPRVHPLLAPLASTGVMQLFMYYLAQEKGHPLGEHLVRPAASL